MNFENNRANTNLAGSIHQSQEVPGTSTEPVHPAIDKVEDGVEHFNIKKSTRNDFKGTKIETGKSRSKQDNRSLRMNLYRNLCMESCM